MIIVISFLGAFHTMICVNCDFWWSAGCVKHPTVSGDIRDQTGEGPDNAEIFTALPGSAADKVN